MSRLSSILPALAVLGLLFFSARHTSAQENVDLRWRTPKRTYLLYKSVAAEQAQAKAQRKVVDKVDQVVAAPAAHFHMFGYEIMWPEKKEQGTGVLNDFNYPISIEDMLMQLAMLTPGKTAKQGFKYERAWNFSRVEGLPPLEIASLYEVGQTADYNKKACTLIAGKHSLANAAPAADESKPFHVWRQFDVDCVSYFNTEDGRLEGARFTVRAVSYELGVIEGSVKRFNYRDWDCEWALARSFDSTIENDLKRYVDSAIVRGRDRLLAMVDKDNLWPSGSHKRGGTALSLLALLICGIGPEHEKIAGGFAAMKDQPVDNMYEVAISLMAYEAKYISDDEKRSFLEDRKVEAKRNVSAEDKKEMQRLLDWIVQNQNKKNPFWNYKYEASATTERYDLSCTQYSLLALGSCLRCGIAIPSGIIRNHVDELRKLQEKDGPEIKRVLGGKPPKPGRAGKTETPEDREPKFTRATKGVKARGWAYSSAANWDKATGLSTAYGSMTCSALTCLMTALDIAAQLTPEQQAKEFGSSVNYNSWRQNAAASFEGGVAWMELRFSVTRNANYGRAWYYYYMYGLERVGVLCDVRYLGEHDWYAEGASALVCLQTPANDWAGNAVDTAFALLFLKRGTVPLKTPPPTHDKSSEPVRWETAER